MVAPKNTTKSTDLKDQADKMISNATTQINRLDLKQREIENRYNEYVIERVEALKDLGVSDVDAQALQGHYSDIDILKNSPRSAPGSKRNSPTVSPVSGARSADAIVGEYVAAIPLVGARLSPVASSVIRAGSNMVFGDPIAKRQEQVNAIVADLESVSGITGSDLTIVENAKEQIVVSQNNLILSTQMVDWIHDSKLTVKAQKSMDAMRESMDDAAKQAYDGSIYLMNETSRRAQEAGEYLDREGRKALAAAYDNLTHAGTRMREGAEYAQVKMREGAEYTAQKAQETAQYIDVEGRKALAAAKDNIEHAGERMKEGAIYTGQKIQEGAEYTAKKAQEAREYAKTHEAGKASLRMGAGVVAAIGGGATGLAVGGSAITMAGLMAGVVKYGGRAVSGLAWGTARLALATSRGIEDMLHKAGRDLAITGAALIHKPTAIISKMNAGHYQELIDKSFELAVKDMPKESKDLLKGSYQVLKQEEAKYVQSIVSGKASEEMRAKVTELHNAIWDKLPEGKDKDNMTKYSGEVLKLHDVCIKEYGEFRNKADIHKEYHALKFNERDDVRDKNTRALSDVFTKVDEMVAIPANNLMYIMPEIVKPAIEAGKATAHLLQGESVHRETRIKEHEAIGGRDAQIIKEVREASRELLEATSDIDQYKKPTKTTDGIFDGVKEAMANLAKAGAQKADEHLGAVQHKMTEAEARLEAKNSAKALGDVELESAKRVDSPSHASGEKEVSKGPNLNR